MGILRLSQENECRNCDCCCAHDMAEDSEGVWVRWSDVEPLLTPLTDEQVLRLAGDFDSIVRTSRTSDKGFDAMRREMLCSLRAVLKEVGRG